MSEKLTLEQSIAAANRILSEAGWHAHPDWDGAFAMANLVGGIQPDKQGCHFKDWTKIQPGHPLHSADTPDEPHEAAAWLAARYGGATAIETARAHGSVFAGAVAFEREPEQGGAHEVVAEPAGPIDAAFDPITAADIEDSRLLEFGAEMAEAEAQSEPPPPQGQDRFFGLDDLDRRRNLRIGDVSVKAAMRAPAVDVARISELRNFTMGVRERLWADDPAKREELDTLEATLRLAHAIGAARDAKIAYLLAATRDEVEAFDPEADWP